MLFYLIYLPIILFCILLITGKASGLTRLMLSLPPGRITEDSHDINKVSKALGVLGLYASFSMILGDFIKIVPLKIWLVILHFIVLILGAAYVFIGCKKKREIQKENIK